MNDCPRSELIVDLMEDLLEGDALAEAQAHVDGCSACQEAREGYLQLMGDLHDLPVPTPSVAARDAAHAAVLAAMAGAAAPAEPVVEAPAAEVTAVAEAPAAEVTAFPAPEKRGRVIPWPLLAAAACLLIALPLAQFANNGTPKSAASLDKAPRAEESLGAGPGSPARLATPAADAPAQAKASAGAAPLEEQLGDDMDDAAAAENLLSDSEPDALAQLERAEKRKDSAFAEAPAAAPADPVEPRAPPADADEADDAAADADAPDQADGMEAGGRADGKELEGAALGGAAPELSEGETERKAPAFADGGAARRARRESSDFAGEPRQDDVAVASLEWEVRSGERVRRYAFSSDGGRLLRVESAPGDGASTPAEAQPAPRGDAGPAAEGRAPSPVEPLAEVARVVRRVEPLPLAKQGAERDRQQGQQQKKAEVLRALTAQVIDEQEAEDLKAILRFELTQPDESQWGERVRSVLSLLVGFKVDEQERASLERMARKRLRAEPSRARALDLEADEAPANAR